jgi:SulP family sulfate permease
MKRMAEVSNIQAITREFENNDDALELGQLKDPNSVLTRDVPSGVEVYEINGPFFFGVADRLKDTLQQIERPPKVFILRMRRVPAVDATGLHALEEFHAKCRRQGTTLILAGVHAQPLVAFTRVGFTDQVGSDNMTENLDDALDRARELLGLPVVPHPPSSAPEVARQAARNRRRPN